MEWHGLMSNDKYLEQFQERVKSTMHMIVDLLQSKEVSFNIAQNALLGIYVNICVKSKAKKEPTLKGISDYWDSLEQENQKESDNRSI